MSSLLIMWDSIPSPFDRELKEDSVGNPQGILSRFRRKKSLNPINSRARSTSRSGTLLVPRPTVMSSDSDESRSVQSNRSRGRTSIKEMMNRLRSTSSVTLVNEPQLKESDFREVADQHDWFVAFDRYNQLVTTQVSRNQTYASEEFTRITNILTRGLGGQFIHGLPEAVFDFALLWCPAGHGSLKDSMEPTWSWTSWSGPVNFPFDPTNCPDLRSIPRAEGELFKSEIKQYHIGPKSSPYELRRSKLNRLRIHYPPYFHAPRGFDATTESNTLRFEAKTIPADSFDIEQLHYEVTKIPCSELVNRGGKQCGVIMDYKKSIAETTGGKDYEFVLVSRNLHREPDTETRRPVITTRHPPGTPIWYGERFVWEDQLYDCDEKEFEEGPWKLLNVILIRWFGDYAERLAVARIHEDEWLKHSPQKKEIALR